VKVSTADAGGGITVQVSDIEAGVGTMSWAVAARLLVRRERRTRMDGEGMVMDG
jgi:hypothetical protein